MPDVIAVIGSGSIGQAIARRVSAGKKVLLADVSRDNAEAVAKTMREAGFDVHATQVDVTSRQSVDALARQAVELGSLTGIIHSAGVSPSSASPATIFRVDLYGAAVVLEIFGNVIARGGSGVLVSSHAGHRIDTLTPEQNRVLATTPAEELLDLPVLHSDHAADPLRAYEIAKRGASLRVQAEAPRWAGRGARVNAISPGIVVTPLSGRELSGPNSRNYRRMIEASAAGRAATPDEVGALGALLMGPEGQFISGSDFLIDGGVTAAYRYGGLVFE